ncbi:Rab-like protein 6 [Dissophora ornata]|nr:Rab-like protein 6 [Dissophora ornata]
MYDISKLWTFEYAARALDEIPINMPVLILSNFTDDSHPRPIVANEQLETLVREHNDARRKHPCAPANLIRHLETSMKTGLGLKEIHESFGIPFLNVLRETHRKQFEQKTDEIEELLKALNGHAQERSRRSIQQLKQQQHPQPQTAGSAAQPLSPKDVTSPRKPFMSAPIQTTGPRISPIPQTSSPTSPARKTRNDHINVQIISPTPVSAQTPAVLFDFNSGKLEEEFFNSIELDPAAAAARSAADEEQGDRHTSLSPITSAEQSLAEDDDGADIDRNPMVAGDEDIGPDSRDELADANPHQTQTQEPTWIPGQVDMELMSRHMVQGYEETHLEEIQDADENEYSYNNAASEVAGEVAEDSETSTGESISPLRYNTQQDSDVESQSDFPIASAMYYEHEPSAFVQDDNDDSLSKVMNASVLASYEEIAEDGRRENPWDSTGNLLRDVALPTAPTKDTYSEDEDQEEQQVKDDKNGDSSPVMTTQSNGMGDLSSRKKAVDVNTNLPSADTSSATAEEPSPAVTVSTEGSGVDIEDNEDDDEETSPTATTGEKKKTKKKGKKKGKKNK